MDFSNEEVQKRLTAVTENVGKRKGNNEFPGRDLDDYGTTKGVNSTNDAIRNRSGFNGKKF